MDTTTLGDLRLSRLLLGSNPFSGFSHQGVDRDERMLHHYSAARIKEALFEAERVGLLPKLVAGIWVGCVFDESRRLAALVAPPDLGRPLLGNHGRRLEGRHRLVDQRDDRRQICLGMP